MVIFRFPPGCLCEVGDMLLFLFYWSGLLRPSGTQGGWGGVGWGERYVGQSKVLLKTRLTKSNHTTLAAL